MEDFRITVSRVHRIEITIAAGEIMANELSTSHRKSNIDTLKNPQGLSITSMMTGKNTTHEKSALKKSIKVCNVIQVTKR